MTEHEDEGSVHTNSQGRESSNNIHKLNTEDLGLEESGIDSMIGNLNINDKGSTGASGKNSDYAYYMDQMQSPQTYNNYLNMSNYTNYSQNNRENRENREPVRDNDNPYRGYRPKPTNGFNVNPYISNPNQGNEFAQYSHGDIYGQPQFGNMGNMGMGNMNMNMGMNMNNMNMGNMNNMNMNNMNSNSNYNNQRMNNKQANHNNTTTNNPYSNTNNNYSQQGQGGQ